jgi:DNA polymerase-1
MVLKKPHRDQISLMDSITHESSSTWRPSEPPNLDDVFEIGYDTETTGLRWWAGDKAIGASLAWQDPASDRIHTYYLPWGHAGGNISEDAAQRYLQSLRQKKLIMLNGPFDLHMTESAFGIDFEEQGCEVCDVGYYGALLDDSRRRFGLDSLSKEYLQEGKLDAGLDMKRMASYHAGEVQAYARQDARLNLMLKHRMWPMMEEEELTEVAELEDRVIYATVEMERNGVPLDMELLNLWCSESEQIILKLMWEINKRAGFRVDVKKREDLERLFRHLGIHNPNRTAVKGEQSFSDEVLAQFDHPIIMMVRLTLEYMSQRQKFLINYRNKVDSNGILRYALHQMSTDDGGTVSGRYSSSGLNREEGVNIQQVSKPGKQKITPKRIEELKQLLGLPYLKAFVIRQLFIPGSGLWGSWDAEQIEYRLFAHFAQDPRILAAYKADPHVDFHKLVMEMVKSSGGNLNRDRTKDLNFALIYGAGIPKAAWMMKTSEEVAEKMFAMYHKAFPRVKPLLRGSTKRAEEQGYVTTILGRRRRFPDKQFTHKAFNAEVQGSAAELNKLGIADLYETRKETGITMRITLHDEADVDVPDEESAKKVQEILDRQRVELSVPILWSGGTGRNWAEAM